jgi:hypothetical protein
MTKEAYTQKKWVEKLASIRKSIMLYMLYMLLTFFNEMSNIAISFISFLFPATSTLKWELILALILFSMLTRLCRYAFNRTTIQNGREWLWLLCFDKKRFEHLKQQQLDIFEKDYDEPQ